uniref:Transmembrane protein n=1 Tax=Caenorhabditis tropicalis TaxID=1561998 RepID=A0A1I7UAZ3_9PELO
MASEISRILISLIVIFLALLTFTDSAPAFCRACNKNCFMSANGTEEINSTAIDVDLLHELETNGIDSTESSRRTKREVEFRACSRFQIEMLLIPLAIAMIPLVLCALFLCTCCCGPKESRGKLPAEFLAALPMSKKRTDKLASEEIELEWGDGYVARKDSSKTKFSTTVSYIEARRESIWSATSVASDTAAENLKHESAKCEAQLAASVPKLTKAKSCDSIKKTRFSDTVSVISLDSGSRR